MALLRLLSSIGELKKSDVDVLRREAGTSSQRMLDVVCDSIGEERLAALLAEHLELSLLDLSSAEIQPDAVKRVSKELATRYDAMPVREQGGALVLALANPLDAEGVKAIEFSGRFKVRCVVATRSQVRDAIRHAYYFNDELSRMFSEGDPTGGIEVVAGTSAADSHDLMAEGEEKASVIRVVQLLLSDGLRLGASDIHIEPTPTIVVVRYRINGVLERGVTIPKALHAQVVARIKVMAALDITEHRRPQDGSIRVRYHDRTADVRVSCLPTPIGETVVLRLLDPDAKAFSLETTGLDAAGIEILRKESRRPEGMILICGPTGSGKNTTAHGILKEISNARLNIVTIENPIEYRLPGATQVEVSEKQGVTFADTLRSILRQDPDVIFVGEVRDAETARIALQAAQTGHLVLTTVHSIDATSSVTRVLNLGVERSLVAASLRLVIAQRLVRTVCPACRVSEPVAEFALERFGAAASGITTVVRGTGCERCRRTGYSGRMGLYEVMPISATLRALIENGAAETSLRARARADGVRSMQACGLEAVAAGHTTIEELARVVPPEEAGIAQGVAAEDAEAMLATAGGAASGTAQRGAAALPDEHCILVVDDDPVIVRTMAMVLEGLSLPKRIVIARSGAEALALLEQQTVHFAVLDVSMDGMSGLELCEKIRLQERHADMPIFMLTAHDDFDFKAQAFRAGADDYLIKSVSPRELLVRVARALARRYGLQVDVVAELAAERSAETRPVVATASELALAVARVVSPGTAAASATPVAPPKPSVPSDAWARFIGQRRTPS